jgi:hypothetical protein
LSVNHDRMRGSAVRRVGHNANDQRRESGLMG